MPSNVADYITTRLAELGVARLFGVPGVTCDAIFEAAVKSSIQPITCSSDLEAGYAADGYARIKGLGAVAVSYGVGTLSLLNAIAGAYAERSSVVVLNGGPSALNIASMRRFSTLFSHSLGREDTDLSAFGLVTAHAGRVARVSEIPRHVDTALQMAVTRRRPVYIEIAKDIWYEECAHPAAPLDLALASTGKERGVAERITDMLSAARSPVAIVGIEVQRYGLASEVHRWLQLTGIPWVTTLLSKSTIDEQASGFVGVFDGPNAAPHVRAAMDGADFVLALGCVLGSGFAGFARASFTKMFVVADGWATEAVSSPVQVDLGTLVTELLERPMSARNSNQRPVDTAIETTDVAGDCALTHDEVMACINTFLDPSFIVVSDIFLGLYPSSEIRVKGPDSFVCNAVWASIGHSLGAAVGIGLADSRRPLVICGDGGFQMTVQALSTLSKYNIRAIVLIIDNGLYGIEQFLVDRKFFDTSDHKPIPYLLLNRWNYAQIAASMGVGTARTVGTVAKLLEALEDARKSQGPACITAVVHSRDLPSELRHAG